MKKLIYARVWVLLLTYISFAVILGWLVTLRGSDLLSWLIIITISAILIYSIRKHIDNKLSGILIVAFLVRVLLMIVHVYIHPLPDSQTDAFTFESTAWDVAISIERGMAATDNGLGFAYSKLLGYLYYLCGRVYAVAIFLNIILNLFTILFIYKIAILYGVSKIYARLAALIGAFFPMFVLFSAITRRENIVTCFFVVSFYYFAKWLTTNSFKYLSYSFVGIFLSTLFHAGMMFVGIVYAIVWVMYNVKEKKLGILNFRIIWAILGMGIAYILLKNKIREKFPEDLTMLLSPEYLAQRLKSLPTGRTMYLVEFIPHNFLDLIWQTPIRMFYFVFSPMLWNFNDISDIVALIDASIYVILLLGILLGWRYFAKDKKMLRLVFVVVLVTGVSIFSWGVSNAGTAMRHRQKFAPIIISLATVALSARMNSIRNNFKK